MKRILLVTTAMFAFSTLAASVARADTVAEQVVSQLQAQGFTRFEVRQGPSQVRIEAIRGTEKVEYVYDLATGQLLSRETESVRPGEDTTPGVEFDTDDDDFVGDDDLEDDDSSDEDDERDEAEDREDDERDEAEDREDDERDEAEDREDDERDEAEDREDDERDEAEDHEDDSDSDDDDE